MKKKEEEEKEGDERREGKERIRRSSHADECFSDMPWKNL